MTQVDSKFVMIAPMEVNEVLPLRVGQNTAHPCLNHFSVLSVYSVAKLFIY
jgi:hypothetical protein